MTQARTLSKADIRRILEYNDRCERYGKRNRAMLLLTHLCGMRIGEVVSLLIADVIDSKGEIKAEIQLSAAQTKGKRARVVFVPTRMRRELKQYVQESQFSVNDEYLFRTQKSKHFTSNTATQLIQRIYARCGFDGATSHSGRRTFITSLSQQGVSVRVLAALAGHSSITTTQRYIDVNDEMLRKAVELV